jgi:hypothetical protein
MTTFTGGVSAIGGFFFGTDINGAFIDANVTLTAIDSLGATIQTTMLANPTSFFGFASTGTLNSLSVASVSANLSVFPTVDNLALAVVKQSPAHVPEPSIVAVLLAGFGAFVLGRWRKKRNSLSYRRRASIQQSQVDS